VLQQMRSAAKYIWIILIIGFVGGFLLAETSGLLGRSPVTTTTVVAKVNGKDIPYLTWAGAAQQLAQQQEQQTQRGLTLDERRQVDEQAFNQLVNDALLQQEYEKRGIMVTDAEVVEAAKYNPPPQFQQAAELQTDGRFDPAKYQRFLASPGARTQGLLVQLENYYRTEIPKQKLFAQIAGDVYVTDARLWQIWKDTHDSATVSYVAFKPDVTAEAKAAVTDAEAQAYYSAHTKEFERQGKATLSLMKVPRRPTAADSAMTVAKIEALRAEIAKGAKFEDVAKRESDDTVSGKNGGDLGKGGKGRFVKEFEDAAYRLSKGELSAPVKTAFGVHLIKVEERKGDTLTLKHILKLYKQGDSAATATDRKADELAKLVAGSDVAAKFDTASQKLGMLITKIDVTENEPASFLGQAVPGASAWAFGGAKIGESSDLFDDEQGYYIVRLDSLHAGGVQPLDRVKDEVKTVVARQKLVEKAMTDAKAFASAAAGSTLEAAAQAKRLTVGHEGPFARSSTVIALGVISEATGAAFSLPVGAVSQPIKTELAAYVLRVDKRVEADVKAFDAQKETQRQQVTRGVREQRVRMFLDNLRKSSKVDDNRKKIQAATRRVTS
jgi:peptidyl-prolyl cis-trans isomerase D